MPNFELTDRQSIEQTLDHVIQGNTAQLTDTAFAKELKASIRFNGTDAVRMLDRLDSTSSRGTRTSRHGSMVYT